MKKLYISKIFQNTDPNNGIIGANIHALQTFQYAGLPIDFTQGPGIAIDSDPNSPNVGKPISNVILLMVTAVDHTKLKKDPNLVQIPVMDPGMKVTATDTVLKNKFNRDLVAIGVDQTEVDTVMAAGEGWGNVMTHFGKKNSPDFDINNFDVTES